MKKTLAMLLAILMLLSACGTADPAETSPSAPPSEVSSTPAEASTSVPSPESPSPPEETRKPSSSEPAPSFDPTATMEETVLVDESDVKITATALKYTAYDVKLSLTIENNSDQDLSFYAGTLGYSCNSINGWMVDDGYLNADVPAGKKANESVKFDIDELVLLGITDIADLELGFDIETDGYDEYLLTGPRQIKTSLANSYDYKEDTYRSAITDIGLTDSLGFEILHDSDEIAFDQKGIRVLSQTLVSNSNEDQVLLVEVENTTDSALDVTLGNISLNSLVVQSGSWSHDQVGAGKRRVISMNLSNVLDKVYQDAFGLQEIGSVSYTLELEDDEGDTLVTPQEVALTVTEGVSYDSTGEELYAADGIRIVSKGLAPDSFEYSDDIHLLLLLENSTKQPLSFDTDYDSVSMNGYMTSFIDYSKKVSPGRAAVLDVELQGYSLEENGITGLEDITEVELTIEVKNDNYKTVASPVVTANFGE